MESNIKSMPSDNFSDEAKLLKCAYQECPYGPNGQKIFKTQRYLEQVCTYNCIKKLNFKYFRFLAYKNGP